MRNAIFDNQEFLDSIRTYEKALSENKHIYLDADELAEIADYYFSRNMLDKAEEVGKYALSVHPESFITKMLQVNILLNIHNDIEAANSLLETLGNCNDMEYVYTKFDILLREGLTDDAIEYIELHSESLDDEEKDDFYLDVVELLLDNNEDEEARKWLNKCKKHDDDYKEIEARLLFNEQEFEKSREILVDILNRHPYEEQSWCWLAKVQYLLNRYDEALSSCDFAIAIEPECSEGVKIKAMVFYSLGNFSEAIRNYKQYLEWYPEDMACIEYLGTCLYQMREFSEAIKYLELRKTILEETEDDIPFELYRNLALSYSALGQKEKALACCDEVDELPDAIPHSYVLRGHVLFELNEFDEGVKFFNEAINHKESTLDLVANVCIIFHDYNFNDMAYKIMSSLMDDISFDYPFGNACLALFAYANKNREVYLSSLDRAVKLSPNITEMLLSGLFPEGTSPSAYYRYAKSNHLL